MRATLRRPNTALRWTSAENMWVDAGTKEMSLEHVHKIIAAGKWCAKYHPSFLKQVTKKPSLASLRLACEVIWLALQ